MKQSHLTLEERYLIHACFVAKFSISDTAAELGRDRSTINTERRRGCHGGQPYCPHRAQQYADLARGRSIANAPYKPTAEWRKVEIQLKDGYSPEQISGRRALLQDAHPISTQAIYNAVQRNHWQQWLYSVRVRRRLKRPAPRPWHGSAALIRERPEEVMSRIEMGAWEADCAIGKQSDQQRILLLVERQSLYERLVLLPNHNAKLTAKLMHKALANTGLPFTSVTTDRGTEFSALGEMFPGKAYVCDPHQPNQRGTNENQIGRLRVDFPKGMSLDKLTQAQLNQIQDKHNHRPRKSLGFLTPYEVAFNCPPLVAFRT